MIKRTLPERIDAVLDGKPMSFHDLAAALYPDRASWRYQSNGGPPGCFMALSSGLRRGGFHVSFETGAGNRMVSPRAVSTALADAHSKNPPEAEHG